MPIPWSCDPHLPGSDYYGGPDSPGFTVWPDGAIVSGLSLSSGRLINAASELLEALREAKTELIHLYELTHPNDESDNATTEVIDQVIAAIALAEGEEGE
jgi:hypothetical protein